MLATGLLILKIIGMILLGILGLILALILVVLLVPIRYRAQASYYGEGKLDASVSWLLHIISCHVAYDGELDMGIRIFGFRVGRKRSAKGGDEDGIAEEPSRADPEDGQADGGQRAQAPTTPVDTTEEQQKQLETEILEELEAERQEERRAGQEQREKQASDTGKKPGRKPRVKMPFSFQGICDKLKEIGQQKDRAEAFLKDGENQRTFRLLWKQARALLRHILPTKLRGKVRFGFDDPYTTGQVLTYISPFYGLYGKKFQVIPVFEEAVLEGEGWLRGRIRIGTVLVLGIRVVFDKNFRQLLRQWRK